MDDYSPILVQHEAKEPEERYDGFADYGFVALLDNSIPSQPLAFPAA